jgi:hypothetical protein
MGAEFDSAVIRAADVKELKRKYAFIQQQRAWEFGHGGYSGTFAEAMSGLIIQRGTWTLEEADKHCSDNHPKWEAAWAYHLDNGRWFVGAWCSS